MKRRSRIMRIQDREREREEDQSEEKEGKTTFRSKDKVKQDDH